MAVNFSDTTPAAPGAGVNVKWQQSGSTASAYLDEVSAVPTSPATRRNSSTGPRRRHLPKSRTADLATTDVTTNNASSTKHGFAPKSPADCDAISQRRGDAGLRRKSKTPTSRRLTSRRTTSRARNTDSLRSRRPMRRNSSTARRRRHTPQVKDSDLALTDITTNNVSITKHGFCPKAPNDATKFLDGTGAFTVGVQPLGSPASGNLAAFSGPTGITNTI
jgi:hypothetical protein